MKNIFLKFSLFLLAVSIHAQDQKISATVAYPLSVGDSFIKDHNGIVDVGVQARFITMGPVKLGGSVNANYFTNNIDLGAIATIKQNGYFVQPRIFIELNLATIEKLKPFLGIGYSLSKFTTNFESSSEQSKQKTDYNGLNINFGLSYDILKKWFVHAQYDIIWVSEEALTLNNTTKNINLLKLGIGYRF